MEYKNVTIYYYTNLDYHADLLVVIKYIKLAKLSKQISIQYWQYTLKIGRKYIFKQALNIRCTFKLK